MLPADIDHLIRILNSYPATKVIHTVADILEAKADVASEEKIQRHVRRFANRLRTEANVVRYL